MKQEIMTIIVEQFSQGAELGKEAWRLRCPECQCSFPKIHRGCQMPYKTRGWLRRRGETEIEMS